MRPTSSRFVLRFMLIVILLTNNSCINGQKKTRKVLVDIGDSLTAGAGGEGTTMSSTTSKFLDKEWRIHNMGVGGENTLTIGARYGSIPMYIRESIKIPADGSKMEIHNGIFSSYNHEKIYPLLQGSAGINPCFIDGIKCKLSRVEEKYFINRIEKGTKDHITKPKSIVVTSLSEEKHNIVTIFIGQNGGYSSAKDFLDQIDLFVRYKGDENFIIITTHDNITPEAIKLINDKYGLKHIDLKKYMSSQAIYDAIELGILPKNGGYPTAEDLERMKNNETPVSLLSDRVHFNSIGYELIGRLRYEKGKELGYW